MRLRARWWVGAFSVLPSFLLVKMCADWRVFVQVDEAVRRDGLVLVQLSKWFVLYSAPGPSRSVKYQVSYPYPYPHGF